MKVLFITHTYPPSIGGMQKQSYELIKGFSKIGEVCKLVYDSSKESKAIFFLFLRSRVKRILKKHKDIDLIHLCDGLMGIFGLLIRSLTDLPIVVTIHGLDIVHPNRFFQKYLLSRFKKAYSAVIAVSRFTASECTKRGFSNVYVVNNGVDKSLAELTTSDVISRDLSNRFGIDLSKKRLLVSIGRPVNRKGFSWFLGEVFPKLSDDIVYVIVGPKTKHIKFISFILNLLPIKSFKLGLSHLFGIPFDEIVIDGLLDKAVFRSRVFYTGSLDFSYISELLHSAQLFIMPNIKVDGDIEGFGLVCLEASLCGCVVLCSGIEGITDAVIDGKNGFYVSAGDAVAWSNKIESLLNKGNNYLEEFGERSRSYTLANYSWDKMARGYYDVFKSFC